MNEDKKREKDKFSWKLKKYRQSGIDIKKEKTYKCNIKSPINNDLQRT